MPMADPIPLVSPDVPTMRDLSKQLGALDSHLGVVHKESALARVAAMDAANAAQLARTAADAAAARADMAREEIAEVRKLVLGDHAQRITQVEARTSRITIPPGAKAGGIGVGAGGIVVALVELWPLVQRWIESR